MTRRIFAALLGFLGFAVIFADTTGSGGSDGATLGKTERDEEILNKFAIIYNQWISRVNARQNAALVANAPANAIVDAGELLEWPKVKGAWRKLEKVVDAYYRY